MEHLLSFKSSGSPNGAAHEYLALLPGLLALFLVNCRPLHKYIRAAAAPSITAAVKQQMHWLELIQTKQSPLLDSLAHASAMSVTVEFYVGLLPLLFWLGWQEVAMKLILGLSITCFVCFAWKDLLCCPRPRHIVKTQRNPSVVVKENIDTDVEYGAPSGHVALSVCLNFYLVNELVQYGILHPESAGSLRIFSALWILWIAYGRMYLGVHTPVDLFTGFLVGLSMYGLWSRIDELVLTWLSTNSNAVVYSFLAFATAIFHWPTSIGEEYTTSFLEAGVTFLGAAFGAVWVVNKHGVLHDPLQLAALRPLDSDFAQCHSTSAFAAKLVVGFSTVLIAKTASKKILRTILPVVMDQVPVGIRQMWLPYCVRNPCFDAGFAKDGVDVKKGAADGDVSSCGVPSKAGGLAWDVEVAAKFLNYACVAVSVRHSLAVFEMLGL